MKPKHVKTAQFLSAGLFGGIYKFSDLEQRISGLSSPQERGDAFEVFAEAYFNTQRKKQATDVWPWGKVPAAIRRKLKISPEQDKGVDGVYMTDTRQVVAYQVKYRGGRKRLHWGGNDGLSTFFGLTDYADQRVVFTNSNSLPEDVLKGRSNFHSVRGHHLDKLTADDFEVIRKWLQTGVTKHERWKPLPQPEKGDKRGPQGV